MMKGNRSLRKGKKLSAGTEAATKGIPSPANSWSMASYSAWNTQHINRNNQYGGKKEIKTSQTRIVTFDCIVFKSGPQKTLKLLDQDRYFHSKNSALCWSSLLFDLQHLLVFIISFITTAVLTRGLRRQRKQQEKKKWKAFKAQFILSKTICDKWVLANKTIHHPHLTFFLSTSRMAWLISFRREGFLKTSSLQDLMTLFMLSKTPITTWRSGSLRTVSKKQGTTISNNFNRAECGTKDVQKHRRRKLKCMKSNGADSCYTQKAHF